MLNEIIYLVTNTGKQYDSDGFEIENSTIKTKVFAGIKTTSYKEYYEASRNGEKVTDIFIVGEDDYNLSMVKGDDGKKIRPNAIEYDGMTYKIIRRYRRATNANYLIELTCTEVE